MYYKLSVTWWIIDLDHQGMKIDRHGQAKIFSQSEIQLLFSQELQTDRDAVPVMGLLAASAPANVAPAMIAPIASSRAFVFPKKSIGGIQRTQLY